MIPGLVAKQQHIVALQSPGRIDMIASHSPSLHTNEWVVIKLYVVQCYSHIHNTLLKSVAFQNKPLTRDKLICRFSRSEKSAVYSNVFLWKRSQKTENSHFQFSIKYHSLNASVKIGDPLSYKSPNMTLRYMHISVYTDWKASTDKWTHTVQICAVQGPTVLWKHTPGYETNIISQFEWDSQTSETE